MIISDSFGIAAFSLTSGLLIGGAVTLLLHQLLTARRLAPQYTTRFMYSGNLAHTNLLDAIQFLELGRREGILHVYVGRRKGYITFANGSIIDAFFRNTLGKEAIFEMLGARYGEFSFESKVIHQPQVVTTSIMDLALEWDMRRTENSGVDARRQDTDSTPDKTSRRDQ
ncbi:MAG: DUF4388 domain-containing protein [Chitinispirillaceae bacterium]|jgi:hypothetical protein|nr:DUF4388 domain-containing protein [Chitinispirillaceae bacterium]